MNLVVLFGGVSSEHEVSLKSAATIIKVLESTDYSVLKVGITKEGKWISTEASAEQIGDGSWKNCENNACAVLSPDRQTHGLLVTRGDKVVPVHVDCVWPVLHGKNGEDGTIQGLCDLAGIPCVGPGVCASAMSMDKAMAKIVVEKLGILQADYFLVKKHAYEKDAMGQIRAITEHFNSAFPLFVKPCSAGSSVGVSKVVNEEALSSAIELALEHDSKVLVEIAIVGREVEVAVLGNEEPQSSIVGEVLSANEFYDYSAKYINSASRTVIPAEISDHALRRLQSDATTIYSALDCKGMSRVDFFLTEGDIPVFNEINTLPGFTNISMYPKLWEASGVSNKELIQTLVRLAVERE